MFRFTANSRQERWTFCCSLVANILQYLCAKIITRT